MSEISCSVSWIIPRPISIHWRSGPVFFSHICIHTWGTRLQQQLHQRLSIQTWSGYQEHLREKWLWKLLNYSAISFWIDLYPNWTKYNCEKKMKLLFHNTFQWNLALTKKWNKFHRIINFYKRVFKWGLRYVSGKKARLRWRDYYDQAIAHARKTEKKITLNHFHIWMKAPLWILK